MKIQKQPVLTDNHGEPVKRGTRLYDKDGNYMGLFDFVKRDDSGKVVICTTHPEGLKGPAVYHRPKDIADWKTGPTHLSLPIDGVFEIFSKLRYDEDDADSFITAAEKKYGLGGEEPLPF